MMETTIDWIGDMGTSGFVLLVFAALAILAAAVVLIGGRRTVPRWAYYAIALVPTVFALYLTVGQYLLLVRPLIAQQRLTPDEVSTVYSIALRPTYIGVPVTVVLGILGIVFMSRKAEPA